MTNWKSASPDRYEILKEFARENRKHQTAAEKALWEMLRGKSQGKKYLRQHIIGDVIVDFLCPETGLVIEVDGGYHAELQQHRDDMLRQEYLESMGHHVIRFSNEAVLHTPDEVIKAIIDNNNN